jgi:hypothetical protein
MALAENRMIMDGIEVMQTQQSGTQSPDTKKASSNPAKAFKSKDFDISKVLDGGPSLSVPARSPRDPNTKSVMLSQTLKKSIDLKEPLLLKQKHMEATYGPKMRNLSPLNSARQKGRKVITRDQIDDFEKFDKYLKSLPNIEFKKQK